MNRRVVRSAPARRDIAEAALYIGRDGPDLIDRFFQGIDETCERLTHSADTGSPFEFAPDSLPDLRYIPVRHFPKYLAFYRIVGDVVQVYRVLHSARDLTRILDPGE